LGHKHKFETMAYPSRLGNACRREGGTATNKVGPSVIFCRMFLKRGKKSQGAKVTQVARGGSGMRRASSWEVQTREENAGKPRSGLFPPPNKPIPTLTRGSSPPLTARPGGTRRGGTLSINFVGGCFGSYVINGVIPTRLLQ